MLKQVLTEQNLINGEWKILKNLIRRLLMFQNIQKLSKLKMFKGLDMIRALTAYELYNDMIYTGGRPFRNTPFSQHCPLFATLF